MLRTGGVERIVKLIDAERARQGLSGRDLAARAGIGVATISRILGGQAVPELETIEALTSALGYKLEAFLVMALASTRKHEEADLIADIVDPLPEEDRKVILALATYLRDTRASAGRG
ncbi:MAG: helix-turn-helix transcriptional regulator [Parcubacteria group bacterium]